MSSHYRKPIRFGKDRLEGARRALKRLDGCIQSLLQVRQGARFSELDQLIYDIRQGVVGAMDDDLNISAALASIFTIVRRVNRLVQEKRIDAEGAAKVVDAFRSIDSVLQLFDFGDAATDPDVQRLIAEREQARRARNWELADRLRKELMSRGVRVQDDKA